MKSDKLKSIFEEFMQDIQGVIIKSDNKFCNIDHIKDLVSTWRSSGYKIVFTAGVFDIFTINHLLALHHYKSLGGSKCKLIVSMDTDKRVMKNKGFKKDKGGISKPILSWENRALMIAKQAYMRSRPLVDAILQHGRDTCKGIECPHDDNVYIAEAIRPDIIVVTSTSHDTIQKLYKSDIISDDSVNIINEKDLQIGDVLLKCPISTSAIIRRILHED